MRRECFELLVETVNRITDPFEQSLFSMVHLSYLQVFEDVNKRTARLVANIPLIRKNLKPLSFVEVDKAAYVSALLGVTSSVCMMGTSHNSKFCQASFKPKKIGSESTRVIKSFLRSYGKELVGRLRFIASHTGVAKHKRYDFG